MTPRVLWSLFLQCWAEVPRASSDSGIDSAKALPIATLLSQMSQPHEGCYSQLLCVYPPLQNEGLALDASESFQNRAREVPTPPPIISPSQHVLTWPQCSLVSPFFTSLTFQGNMI